MKTLKLCLPILLSVALLGCNNEAVATTTQTISVQKVTPANVAKPKSTTLKQNDDSEVQLVESVTEPVEEVTESVTTKKSAKSVNSNSAVKDVIIDGTGSLVLSKADGTFVSFAPVQGPVGPQGPAGPAGPQGESIKGDKGDQGEPGKDGRGIDHLELDADKNLIAYYTDGTTQNVGNLTVTVPSEPVTPPSDEPTNSPTDNTPEYEKIGYKVPIDFGSVSPKGTLSYVSNEDSSLIKCDYEIDKLNATLTEVKQPTKYDPYSHFVYDVEISYTISNCENTRNQSYFIVHASEYFSFGNFGFKNGYYTDSVKVDLTSPITETIVITSVEIFDK